VEGESDQKFEARSAMGAITEKVFQYDNERFCLLSPSKIISYANEVVTKFSQSFVRALKGGSV